MSDIDEQAPKITGQMHEFAFDVLARIVPGIVLIASYFASDLKGLDASLLIGVGVVVAYVVGYAIELTTLLVDKCIISPILKWLESRYNSSENKSEYRHGQSLLPITELQMWVYEVQSKKKARYFKMLAERSMWRSIVFICCWFCFSPPAFMGPVSQQIGIDVRLLPYLMVAAATLGFYYLSYFLSSHARWRV
jgi:hypothetical protein